MKKYLRNFVLLAVLAAIASPAFAYGPGGGDPNNPPGMPTAGQQTTGTPASGIIQALLDWFLGL
jgi:hypothetical protein